MTPSPPPRRRWLRPGSWPWPGLWRLVSLGLAAWWLRLAAPGGGPRGTGVGIPLEQVQRLLPDAARLAPRDPERGGHRVLNRTGGVIGYVLVTAPEGDAVIGYSGPNNLLVALDAAGAVAGLELLESRDTPDHVAAVRGNPGFWKQFLGWTPGRVPLPRPDAVSGSTLTSLGIAEALQTRLAGRAPSLRFPEPITLEEIAPRLPGAAALEADVPRPGWWRVTDAGGRCLGFVLRTSPQAETVRGHAGPTEALALVEPDGRRIREVRLRRSYDTADYVERVREDTGFLAGLAGRTVEEWRRIEFRAAGIEGVSGATETSYAVAEGLRRRLVADGEAVSAGQRTARGRWREGVLLMVLAGAGAMAWGGLRGRPGVRRFWQWTLVLGFGLGCGDLLSLALLSGWAEHGVAWSTAPVLVLVAAAALSVPWFSGRGLYCQHLCPHGAAQELLGGIRRWRWTLPREWATRLERVPGVLLALGLLLPMAGVGLDLTLLEPFDAWTLTRWLSVPVVLAVLGLSASLFVPMAYCRYGCPTGALLRFLRDGRVAHRWDRRDLLAAVCLAAGGFLVMLRAGAWGGEAGGGTAGKDTRLGGRCFGTTWSVTVRGAVGDKAGLEGLLAGELETIESRLSHWRPTSATAQFNAAGTTLPMEVPSELAGLLERVLSIARASGGALDPTVGGLVRAWGFGPGEAPPLPPDAATLAGLRARTGWQRLTVDVAAGTVAKSHPALELDLGSVLQGYAADRLGERLRAAGFREFLVDVGGELLAGGVWTVAVEDPRRTGRVLRRVRLQDAALATSGTYRTRLGQGAASVSHLLDPRTGMPVDHDTFLVSVVHRSCMEADGWATAVLVGGGWVATAPAREAGAEVLTASGRGAELQVRWTEGFPMDEAGSMP